jgi:4-amino-4-deoxy-L-arabinose transferase-like glycosyltransferase
MKTHSKKSCGWALVLVILGLLALYGGPRGLALLIPVAILVWYAVAEPTPRDGRN